MPQLLLVYRRPALFLRARMTTNGPSQGKDNLCWPSDFWIQRNTKSPSRKARGRVFLLWYCLNFCWYIADLDKVRRHASSLRSTPSSRASLASASVYMAWRGESNSISQGMIASAPYTRKKGVNPVERFGVVCRLQSTIGSSYIHVPAALSRGSTNLGLI